MSSEAIIAVRTYLNRTDTRGFIHLHSADKSAIRSRAAFTSGELTEPQIRSVLDNIDRLSHKTAYATTRKKKSFVTAFEETFSCERGKPIASTSLYVNLFSGSSSNAGHGLIYTTAFRKGEIPVVPPIDGHYGIYAFGNECLVFGLSANGELPYAEWITLNGCVDRGILQLPIARDGQKLGTVVVEGAEGSDVLLSCANPLKRHERIESLLRYLSLANNTGLLMMDNWFDVKTRTLNSYVFERETIPSMVRWWMHEKPFSLIIFDLNNFKPINDNQSYLAGDKALALVARAAETCVKPSVKDISDTVGRLGGDEFWALVMAGAGEARHAAKRILENIMLINAEEDGIRGLSAGFAILDETWIYRKLSELSRMARRFVEREVDAKIEELEALTPGPKNSESAKANMKESLMNASKLRIESMLSDYLRAAILMGASTLIHESKTKENKESGRFFAQFSEDGQSAVTMTSEQINNGT